MKDWKVDYSVRFKDGTEEEHGSIIEAETIFEALEEAGKQCEDIQKCNPNIEKIILWNVCIMQMDVF